MRNELFEELINDNNEEQIEELYNPDERTELEIIKEHNKILRDYVVELENRNIILKERILRLEREINYYENKSKGLI